MANLTGLANIVGVLRAERTNLVNQLRHVDAALSVLGKLEGGRLHTRPRRILSATARRKISFAQKARWAKSRGQASAPKPRTMSAAARRRIAAAQRARWAKVKGQKVVPIEASRRHISAAGRARIAAAARARWARVRAGKK